LFGGTTLKTGWVTAFVAFLIAGGFKTAIGVCLLVPSVPRISRDQIPPYATLLPWVPAGGVRCVAVDLPQHRGNVALPCPHDCGSEIEYSLTIRTRQDGEVFYYQAPPECPGCHRELPMLPDAHFERLTQGSE